MILIYAFSNRWGTNVSRLTLLQLQKIIENNQAFFQKKTSSPKIIYRLVNSYPQEFYRKYIQGSQYQLIIGLGDSPFGKIRIETQAKNYYLNKPIYQFSPILIDLSLPNLDNFDSKFFTISSNMGTYNCNWLVFSTQTYLIHKKLPTKHIFLHLPKKSNASFIAHQIKNLLEINHLI